MIIDNKEKYDDFFYIETMGMNMYQRMSTSIAVLLGKSLALPINDEVIEMLESKFKLYKEKYQR